MRTLVRGTSQKMVDNLRKLLAEMESDLLTEGEDRLLKGVGQHRIAGARVGNQQLVSLNANHKAAGIGDQSIVVVELDVNSPQLSVVAVDQGGGGEWPSGVCRESAEIV